MVLPTRTFVDPTSICGKEEKVSGPEFEIRQPTLKPCLSLWLSRASTRNDDNAAEEGYEAVVNLGLILLPGCV